VTLTFDLLTLKVVSECDVVFLIGLSVLGLSPTYATDRQTSDVRLHHSLMLPGRGHNKGHVDVFMDLLLLLRTQKSKM